MIPKRSLGFFLDVKPDTGQHADRLSVQELGILQFA